MPNDDLIIRLPCKVGDLLYEVDLPEYGLITCKVISISYYNGPEFHVPGNKLVSVISIQVEVIAGHGLGSSYCFTQDNLGKTAFFDRNEAQLALDELSK